MPKRIIIIFIIVLLPYRANAALLSLEDDFSPVNHINIFPGILSQDLRYVFSAPARWDRSQWERVLLYTSLTGAVMGFDNELYRGVQRNRSIMSDNTAKIIQSFGSYTSFGIIGSFYIYSMARRSYKELNVTRDLVAASIISGLITFSLKVIAGRSRPIQQRGTYKFKPFGGDHSFPSGHTTQAFVLASVISSSYESKWVWGISYTLASLVGLARVHQQAHFPSDVVAGAIIGTSVGRGIVDYNKGLKKEIYPKTFFIISPDGTYMIERLF